MKLVTGYCQILHEISEGKENHKEVLVQIGNKEICKSCIAEAAKLFGDIVISEQAVRDKIEELKNSAVIWAEKGNHIVFTLFMDKAHILESFILKIKESADG